MGSRGEMIFHGVRIAFQSSAVRREVPRMANWLKGALPGNVRPSTNFLLGVRLRCFPLMLVEVRRRVSI